MKLRLTGLLFLMGFTGCAFRVDGTLTEFASSLTITTPVSGAIISTFERSFVGTCDEDKPIEVTLPEGAFLTSFSCKENKLKMVIGFDAHSGDLRQYIIKIKNDRAFIEHVVYFAKACPENYVAVAGNPTVGIQTQDFCVSKYEMKAGPGVAPESRPTDTPLLVERDGVSGAKERCLALGTSYSLMSNAQWQTLARNIEKIKSNWLLDDEILRLPRGLTQEIASAASSEDDNSGCHGITGFTDSCFDAGWGSGGEFKRTHTLSTGATIWDVGGNESEWVSDTPGTDITPTIALFEAGASTEYEFSSTLKFPFLEIENTRRLFAPKDFSKDLIDSQHGMGRVLSGSGGSYGGGILRGGDFDDADAAGIFTTKLPFAGTGTLAAFRCVSRPL